MLNFIEIMRVAACNTVVPVKQLQAGESDRRDDLYDACKGFFSQLKNPDGSINQYARNEIVKLCLPEAQRMLLAVLKKKCPHKMRDHDDLMGAFSLRLVKHIGNFDPKEGRMSTYLYSIIKSVVMDSLKYDRRKQLTSLSEDDLAAIPARGEPDKPEFPIDDPGRLLSCLCDTYQQVLQLRLNGLSSREIAEQIGKKTPAAVNMMVHRALEKLKRFAAEQQAGSSA